MQQNAHYAAPDASGSRPAHPDWRYPEEAQPEVAGRPRGNPLGWPDRILLALVALLLLGLHLRADAGEISLTLDDVASGLMLAATDTPGEYVPLSRLDTRVVFDVSGPLVRVGVRQTFRNASTGWIEGIYVFPLPDDAAVDRLRLVTGDRIIEGEIRERGEARSVYAAARDAGRVAGLVEQERPNLFTTRVANIGPGEEILVEIAFQHVLRPEDGRYELRFPLTLTRRYVPPPDITDVAQPHKIIETIRDARRISPPMADGSRWEHPVRISVHLDAGLPLGEIRSDHHDILMEQEEPGAYTIILADETVPAERDFVLRWSVVRTGDTETAVFTQNRGEERFALILLTPPQPDRVGQVPDRNLIFVIDTSGSMHGESIRQARQALVMALNRLRTGDRFDVIAFNNSASSLFGNAVSASAYHVRVARQFVGHLRADGGTNIAAALELALNHKTNRPGRLRQVVFITDGSVGNEARLFEQISRDLGDTRLFTVGIGSAPNTWFMRQAARYGRGSYTFIDSVTGVSERMDALFAKLERPALTGLSAEWNVPVESFPDPLPDVYAGEPVLVTARLPAERAVLELHGDGGWMRRVYLDDTPEHPGIARLWARSKIEDFENLRVLGANAAEIRRLIVETALTYGLVSRYTSLVAVDRTPVRVASAGLKRDMLPALIPAGSAVGWPGTATSARLWLLAGIACLLLGLSWTWTWVRSS